MIAHKSLLTGRKCYFLATVGGKYECQYCDMTFSNSGSVTNHMKRRHREVKEALEQISEAKKIERQAAAMKAKNAKKRQNIFKLTKGKFLNEIKFECLCLVRLPKCG